MRVVHLIEAPSNLGLKEPAPGKEPGVKKLPAWLKQHGFYDLIQPEIIHTVTPPPYSMRLDEEAGVRNAGKISVYSQQVAQVLMQVVGQDAFPVVLGGDCSILIGNSLALKTLGKYGIFFMDGHTDFAWPALSQTKGAAGMDLAIVTGYGHDKLSNMNQAKPYVEEEQVWCVGNRDFDEAYVQAIRPSKIQYVDLLQVREAGIETCVRQFLSMVAERKLDGFWIHLDVDVLDDAVMPAVDSRQTGGLSYAELTASLNGLLQSGKAVGLEITILDPDLDADGEFTTKFINEWRPVWQKYVQSCKYR